MGWRWLWLHLATHDGKMLFKERTTMVAAMLTKPPCRYWNCFFHQQSDFFEAEKERRVQLPSCRRLRREQPLRRRDKKESKMEWIIAKTGSTSLHHLEQRSSSGSAGVEMVDRVKPLSGLSSQTAATLP